MQSNPGKLPAIISILGGGLLLVVGLAGIAGFLGLPFSSRGDVFGYQMGIMAVIFLGLGCGSLAVFHGFGMLIGRPSHNFGLPPAYFFWILFGLALGLGNVVLNAKVAVNFIFPFIFVLGAALPTLAVLAVAVRRLGASASWRDVSLMFVSGSTISLLTAFVLEGILPYLAYVVLIPLGILGNGFSTPAFGASDFIERIFFSPMIVVFLLFTAIQAPIPEEFAKALGPGMLAKGIQNERQAFIVGLAAGAGFAILENMLYEGVYAQWNGWTWGGITLLRGIGSILHPLCTGILALGLFRARTSEKGWLATVGPAYLLSVGMHTLWNGGFEPLVYLAGLDQFMGGGASFSLYGTYVQGILVIFLVALSVALWMYFNRLLNRLGQDVALDLVPALISRRALAALALGAVALFVPIGAMLGPSWGSIQAAAVGGLPTRTPTRTLAPTITPTITPTPTRTLTPTPLFAGASANYLATATAFSQATSGVLDGFDAANNWTVGGFDDNYVKGSRKIEGGKYLWSVTAKQGAFAWVQQGENELPDKFFLAVDATGPGRPGVAYGLVFRANQAAESYYLFEIYDDSYQGFAVQMHSPTGWETVIPYRLNRYVHPGALNQLAVLADNSSYVLFVNGQYVASFQDSRLVGGQAGLGVDIQTAGESENFTFDNFQLGQ